MKSTIERRLMLLEQRMGRAAPTVVRIRDGETPEAARLRHRLEHPHAFGKPVVVVPMPCATAEEWAALHGPGAA